MSGLGKVVCVTGASGYVASYLVKLLLDRGYTVKATVRNLKLIEPAVKGTLNVLKSCIKFPTVRRVVLTASIITVLCKRKPKGPDVVVDETWFADKDLCEEQKDVLAAGTDTSAITLDWAMAELFRHPSVMEKLRKEIRGIVKEKQDITEDDLKQMPYLKAVIKETLRHHPPAPLLARLASRDVKVKEYDVAAGTVVLVNAWAIGRDPVSWDELELFKPERFFNSEMDFKGLDFEFIPFGAGRRGCPGIEFAVATIELVLANLVLKFKWELPDGKDLDMSETPGIAVHRSVPLLAVAS